MRMPGSGKKLGGACWSSCFHYACATGASGKNQLHANWWCTVQSMMAALSLVTLLHLLLLLPASLAQTGDGPTLSPTLFPTDPQPETPSEGCRGPTDGGLLCYLSTDCRGFLVNDGVTSTVAECCAGVGLSYCNEDGCGNCFSECVCV